MRTREFRRAHLNEVDSFPGWSTVSRDGLIPFSIFSAGHGEETLLELESEDVADALAASLERRGS